MLDGAVETFSPKTGKSRGLLEALPVKIHMNRGLKHC